MPTSTTWFGRLHDLLLTDSEWATDSAGVQFGRAPYGPGCSVFTLALLFTDAIASFATPAAVSNLARANVSRSLSMESLGLFDSLLAFRHDLSPAHHPADREARVDRC